MRTIDEIKAEIDEHKKTIKSLNGKTDEFAFYQTRSCKEKTQHI